MVESGQSGDLDDGQKGTTALSNSVLSHYGQFKLYPEIAKKYE